MLIVITVLLKSSAKISFYVFLVFNSNGLHKNGTTICLNVDTTLKYKIKLQFYVNEQ